MILVNKNNLLKELIYLKQSYLKLIFIILYLLRIVLRLKENIYLLIEIKL